MKLTCELTDHRGEPCKKDATRALLTFDFDGWSVNATCDDCAPEVMHEMKCSGYTDDDIIRVTIDPPTVNTCWCDAPATYRQTVDPYVTPGAVEHNGEYLQYVCANHITSSFVKITEE